MPNQLTTYQPEVTLLAVKLIGAYLDCSTTLQESAREMIDIIRYPGSDDDERNMAVATLTEILFPNQLSIDA